MTSDDRPYMHALAVGPACDELDYADMVALSGMFRRWAIHETDLSPAQHTRLIQYSADYERLAAWVGQGWRARDPEDDPSLMKSLATLERRTSNVVELTEVRALLAHHDHELID